MRNLQVRYVLDRVAEQNQIQIQRARSGWIGPLTTVCLFDFQESVEDFACAKGRFASGNRIQISRLILQTFPFGIGLDEIGNREVGDESREPIDGESERRLAVAEI